MAPRHPTFLRHAALALLGLALLSAAASAHDGPAAVHGLGAGAAHPLGGADHLLAMLAVGLWAAQLGGRAMWLLPLTFAAVMSLGGALGMAGFALPGAERSIAASVLVLGVLVAACARLPLPAGALLVGLFAFFHGHTHGAEMPATAGGFGYATGFLGVTIALHLAGIGLALGLQRLPVAGPTGVRALGAAVSLAGLLLLA